MKNSLVIFFMIMMNATIGFTWDGAFTLYENDGFKKNPYSFDVSKYEENKIINFHKTKISDKASSIKWKLPKGINVTLYQKKNGKGSRYTIHGIGRDTDLHSSKFGDCFSSFKWYKGDPLLDTEGKCKGRSTLNVVWRGVKDVTKEVLDAGEEILSVIPQTDSGDDDKPEKSEGKKGDREPASDGEAKEIDVPCPDCKGEGTYLGNCPKCGGSGIVSKAEAGDFDSQGGISGDPNQFICPLCKGKGTGQFKCETCKGTGKL